MPRFVILTHDYPALHWDIMLEKEASLRAWRLLKPADTMSEVPAEPLPDHRLAYLDYEGPISGNRGRVVRWDHGEFTPVSEGKARVEVELRGGRLVGRAVFNETANGWRFHFTASPGSDRS